jgi:hypothetical protein
VRSRDTYAGPLEARAVRDTYAGPLNVFAWSEDDHPRDANGRFSSHGTRDAGEASKQARKKKTSESHKAASHAHQEAAGKHRAEAERRRTLARKKRLPASERKKHEAAAARHEAAAKEHEKLSAYHRDVAPSLEDLGVEHKLGAESKRTVEGAIAKGGYGRFLRKSPLGSVEEHSLDPNEHGVIRSANGVYARPKKGSEDKPFVSLKNIEGVEVAHARSEKKWAKLGRRAGPGDPETFSLSTLAKTPEEMRERTMVHELGHHIHLSRSDPLPKALDKEIVKAYAARVNGVTKEPREGAWIASVYARGDHKEWFAETHSAYVYHGKELKKRDPEAFDLMRRVRQCRGMDQTTSSRAAPKAMTAPSLAFAKEWHEDEHPRRPDGSDLRKQAEEE